MNYLFSNLSIFYILSQIINNLICLNFNYEEKNSTKFPDDFNYDLDVIHEGL